MPLDDAIGRRISRAAPGRCAPNLSRSEPWANRFRPVANPHDERLDVSASTVVATAALVDVIVLSMGVAVTAVICQAAGAECAAGIWLITAFVTIVVALESQRRLSVYSLTGLRNVRGRLTRMMLANLMGGTAGVACLGLISVSSQAWFLWLPAWFAVSLALGGLAAIASAQKVSRLCDSGRLAHNVAVVGTGAYARDFIQDLRDQPGDLVRYAGTLDEGDGQSGTCADLPANGQVTGVLARAPGTRIDSVVLCVPIGQTERIARLRSQLRKLNCDIYVAGDFLDLTWASGALDRLGHQRVIKIEGKPLNDWQLLQKAALDRLGAAILLVALAPLLLVIALFISLDSGGAVLFRQPRVGLNNRPFTMFKFRTMYDHQSDLHGDLQATRNDPRVTRVGWFLRRTSLDELPQLLNVLAGDMSLVGPRPHAAATKAGGRLFADVVADYSLRHRVKPGITGWAQVNGWRGETATFHHIEQRVAHDLHYIENWSLMFDVRILILTLVRELNSKAAF